MKNDSSYPHPPWQLRGSGLIVASWQPLPEKRVLPNAEPVSLWGRRTLSGLYIARYDTPLNEACPVPWHEWGQVLGRLKQGKQKGLFIDAMGVDSMAAEQGGVEVWGLNKFRSAIRVANNQAHLQDNCGEIALHWKRLPLSIFLTQTTFFFTRIQNRTVRYSVRMKGWVYLSRVTLTQNTHSRLNRLAAGPYWGIAFVNAQVTITPPIAPPASNE